jgi:hypothetical protein
VKWLLVTTANDNPGDRFIRLGTQRLIEAVDPAATFTLVDKESAAIHEPQPFDRAVWCGMPLFWSHAESWSWSMDWWPEVGKGWLSADPRRYLILGVGSFARWPHDPGIHQLDRLHDEALAVKEGCWRLIARDEVAPAITGVPMEVMPCPALFATRGVQPSRRASLCNLMPDGGHFRMYGQLQAKAWAGKVAEVAGILRQAGFQFAAHNAREAGFARSLGFENIIEGDALLEAYAGCVRYFGNRVHGGIVSAGAGAEVWSVGYDTRQEAVRRAGGHATAPADLDVSAVAQWAQRPPRATQSDVAGEFERQRLILADFAS